MSLPTTTKTWILTAPPVSDILPDTFKLVTRDLPALKDGEVLVKVKYFSNDPAQRTWMQANANPAKMYISPVLAGDVIHSGVIGSVLATKSDKFKVGETVTGTYGWSEYLVVDEKGLSKVDDYEGLSETATMSVLGGTTLTAWCGLFEVGKVTADQTIIISGAGGATGIAAVQIAKHIIGCKKVIGIAGGADKCEWVKSLGADECLDYKSPNFFSDLKKREKFDVFYDNVGGKILDAVIEKMVVGGTIIACGAVSAYNDPSQYAITNWLDVVQQRLTIHGLLVLAYIPLFGEIREKLVKAIKEGKFSADGVETVVDTKFEDVPKTWGGLFTGENRGKLITKLV